MEVLELGDLQLELLEVHLLGLEFSQGLFEFLLGFESDPGEGLKRSFGVEDVTSGKVPRLVGLLHGDLQRKAGPLAQDLQFQDVPGFFPGKGLTDGFPRGGGLPIDGDHEVEAFQTGLGGRHAVEDLGDQDGLFAVHPELGGQGFAGRVHGDSDADFLGSGARPDDVGVFFEAPLEFLQGIGILPGVHGPGERLGILA